MLAVFHSEPVENSVLARFDLLTIPFLYSHDDVGWLKTVDQAS